MKSRLFLSLLLACIFTVDFNFKIEAQTTTKFTKADDVKTEQTAIKKLRELYAARDFESGSELGRKFAEQFPASVELQAWLIVNTARNEMSAEAVESAKKLVEYNGENAWAQFALAHALIRNLQIKESIPVVETAVKMMPDDEEFIFLYASALLSQRKFDEIYAWLDKNSPKIKDQSRLLYVKAEAEYRQFSAGKDDEAKRKRSFESFAKAVKISPNSVSANYIYGVYLYAEKRFAEALPVLKKAAALAPGVAHVRQTYWQAMLAAQPKKTAEQKNNEVIADINDLLRLRPDSVNAFDAAASFYGRQLQMPEKKEEIDRKIIEKFPQTASAERILIEQIKEFNYYGEDKKIDDEKKARLFQMLKNFINRPKHYNENYYGEAYKLYFAQANNDKNIPNTELLQIAEKISERQKQDAAQIYSMIVSGLAERKMFQEAENFAEIGFEKLKKENTQQRAAFRDENRIQNDLSLENATLYAARGWLYYKENRIDDAERELLRAVKLNNETSYFYNELGQVYEAKNDLEKAEDAYINAYSIFSDSGNPNFDKIKAVYQKRGGNLIGFEEYFEKVKIIERRRRKERVLAARIVESENVAPFALKNLEAKPVAFDNLKGKIVVVNIWGTWCSPCVHEMPEFQELYKKYQGDKDVVILTINNDGDLNLVKTFMSAKKYDFTVLLGDKYLEAIGIDAFPTTWFIDRDGKISFVKTGASDKLLEEFGWRIEELKNQH